LVVDLEDYSLARVIKGLYGSEYKTIAVDADGNIIGVFKGDYAGTLTTLAVDSQGRIQAVLADPEDVFGNPNYMGAAELAARLGSINTFERRGTTVWMDDFEAPVLKWNKHTGGTGGTITLVTDSCHLGSQAMKINVLADADGWVKADRNFEFPLAGKIGFEWCISPYILDHHIIFGATVDDATTKYTPYIKYDNGNNTWYYMDSGDAYQPLSPTRQLIGLLDGYHHIKIVVDTSTGLYVRLQVGGKTYDLSSYSMPTAATDGYTAGLADIQVTNQEAGYPAPVYVDSFIYTQNEL